MESHSSIEHAQQDIATPKNAKISPETITLSAQLHHFFEIAKSKYDQLATIARTNDDKENVFTLKRENLLTASDITTRLALRSAQIANKNA